MANFPYLSLKYAVILHIKEIKFSKRRNSSFYELTPTEEQGKIKMAELLPMKVYQVP